MPLVESTYCPPFGLKNGHAATIFPVLFRRVPPVDYVRTRLELADGDFLDLDWLKNKNRRLVIIAHGLESDSQAQYMRAMALALSEKKYDVLAWNCRGCSGEPNRLLRSYHSGISEDLREVVAHALELGYEEVFLVGFSLGGNITLKYIGEEGAKIDPRVKAAVAVSVPCDLTSSSLRLGKFYNQIYMRRFMDGLKTKILQKKSVFPDYVDLDGLNKMRTFGQFDERYTAPLNGFSGARDYWEKASSRPHLEKIAIPTLLINAADDPFLDEPCFPREVAENNPHFFLEIPKNGGHVGFSSWGKVGWLEKRASAFFAEANNSTKVAQKVAWTSRP